VLSPGSMDRGQQNSRDRSCSALTPVRHISLCRAVQLGAGREVQGVTVVLGLSEGTEVGNNTS